MKKILDSTVLFFEKGMFKGILTDFGEVHNFQKVDLLDPKSGLFGPQPPPPLNPPTKTPFLVHFVAE